MPHIPPSSTAPKPAPPAKSAAAPQAIGLKTVSPHKFKYDPRMVHRQLFGKDVSYG